MVKRTFISFYRVFMYFSHLDLLRDCHSVSRTEESSFSHKMSSFDPQNKFAHCRNGSAMILACWGKSVNFVECCHLLKSYSYLH